VFSEEQKAAVLSLKVAPPPADDPHADFKADMETGELQA